MPQNRLILFFKHSQHLLSHNEPSYNIDACEKKPDKATNAIRIEPNGDACSVSVFLPMAYSQHTTDHDYSTNSISYAHKWCVECWSDIPNYEVASKDC